MSKQIKAEIFRMMNSGKARFGNGIYYLGILLIVMCFYPFSEHWENLKESLSVNMLFFLQNVYILTFIVQVVVVVLLMSKYQNRTYYYEIMYGENTHNIILSNILVYGGYIFLVFMLPNIVLYTVLAIKNGLGGYGNIVMLVLLFGVVLLRVVARAVLITMLLRRMLPVFAILYLVFLGDQTLVSVISTIMNSADKILTVVLNLFVSRQLIMLYQPVEYVGSFIITVVGSFLVEIAILYGLTWCSYRRKRFA